MRSEGRPLTGGASQYRALAGGVEYLLDLREQQRQEQQLQQWVLRVGIPKVREVVDAAAARGLPSDHPALAEARRLLGVSGGVSRDQETQCVHIWTSLPSDMQ